MAIDGPARLEAARDYGDVFRLVKDVVEREVKRTRAGLMLGLSRLGLSPAGYLGGYFVLGTNAIVLNRDVLERIQAERPDAHFAYTFHVLLHEYLHTLGYIPEDVVRPLALRLTLSAFPEDHPAALVAAAMVPGVSVPAAAAYFRSLVLPEYGYRQAIPSDFEIVRGFDPDATPYIG